jgi:hypothetical protein
MGRTCRRAWLPVVCVLAEACAAPDTAAPLATPTASFATTDVALGSPVDVTYRFAVAPDAPPLPDGYWVFVHFLDEDEDILWTDDHEPVPSTGAWKAGSTIEYTRTIFVPKLPYVGTVRVDVGLYSRRTGDRLPLAGATTGMRAYRAGALTLRVDPNQIFVALKEGWHGTETTPDGSIEWQWSRREGVLAFRNPKRDATLLLQLDQPVTAFPMPQLVEVRLGPERIDAFALPPEAPILRRIYLSASLLGAAEVAEITVAVDKTFVPSGVPSLQSTDPRELGVRLFRAYLQPK